MGHLSIGGLRINEIRLGNLHDPGMASGLQECLHGQSPQDIVHTGEDQDAGIGGGLGVRHGNEISGSATVLACNV